MFTGIIECIGQVEAVHQHGANLQFEISAPFTSELKIDQSVAHNGVCLTVDGFTKNGNYTVTAIAETLRKTNLGTWKLGQRVNLERCLQAGARLDGHIVQGHVDTTAKLLNITPENGSWLLRFSLPTGDQLLVPKGSICINGASLTLVDVDNYEFSVALIPYTWEHTNLSLLKPGDPVNIEFDILGKYMLAWIQKFGNPLQNTGQ